MAGNRRSSREIKIRKDSDFIYDNRVLKALLGNSTWNPQLNSQSASNCSDVSSVNPTVKCVNSNKTVNWNNINLSHLPNYIESSQANNLNNIDSSVFTTVNSRSQSYLPPHLAAIARASEVTRAEVNKPASARPRIKSSTDFDILETIDAQGNAFLSAESCSGMSDSESEAIQSTSKKNTMVGNIDTPISPTVSDLADDGLRNTLLVAIKNMTLLTNKVDKLTNKVVGLTNKVDNFEGLMLTFDQRLEHFEGSNRGTDSESENRAIPRKDNGPKKNKPNRVEFEKDRHLGVIYDTLGSREKKTEDESEGNTSEPELDLDGIKKMVAKTMKTASARRVKSTLDQIGANFPDEGESENSAESGEDSDSDTGKKRKKVKSGAKVKRRPVVRTELWPHTIANEDDGEETTSEDISLAKFLSCFTYIMTTCGRRESTGRCFLLHAICTVLECLPWAEARSFHNLAMTKIEQDRMDWKADFPALASQFLEKKVRQSLRTKAQSTSSSRSGNRNLGKGFNNTYNRGYNHYSNYNNRPLAICRLWNEGSCSFGDRCKYRHVCSACADKGKSGESHKASSQGCPNTRRGN